MFGSWLNFFYFSALKREIWGGVARQRGQKKSFLAFSKETNFHRFSSEAEDFQVWEDKQLLLFLS
jgi:hypothetical protein